MRVSTAHMLGVQIVHQLDVCSHGLSPVVTPTPPQPVHNRILVKYQLRYYQ